MITLNEMRDMMTPGYEERKRKRYEALCKAYENATPADLGPGPAMDYNKGPGNWTGD